MLDKPKIISDQTLIIKDEVLLTVGCPIFPPFYIDSQISVHRKFKKIDQLIFRNAKEIYFNEKLRARTCQVTNWMMKADN
jgi:hypothetical protein